MRDGMAWVKKKNRYSVALMVAADKIIDAPSPFAHYLGRDYAVVRMELERAGLEVREVADLALPAWWPTWLPVSCVNGHPWRPGTLGMHWYPCECPGATYHGHHRARCRTCDWALNPPDCQAA